MMKRIEREKSLKERDERVGVYQTYTATVRGRR
jgi:hypothetical protein